jgi:hypothetical protein
VYRNASYNPKDSTIYLRTWSEDGDRIDTEIPFSPYLYTEKEGAEDGLSIFKTPLRKHIFRNSFERNRFVDDTKTGRLFGNLPVDQQFLIDTFNTEVDKVEFSKYPLKVYFIDIETSCANYTDNHKIKIRKKQNSMK